MNVNRYLPHLLVLPEDDANRQLANGFVLDASLTSKRIQVLPPAGGWIDVLDHFVADHVSKMGRYPSRLMLLLIDFDGHSDRLLLAKNKIPIHLADRVFILGSLKEPELLRADLGSYEAIGLKLAKDCRNGTDDVWGHALLRHNAAELARLRQHVRPILFV